MFLAVYFITSFHRPHLISDQETCVSNLQTIEWAKNKWAAVNNKNSNDVPQDSDLFGINSWWNTKPVCPSGGSYTLGNVATLPTCSIPGHNL